MKFAIVVSLGLISSLAIASYEVVLMADNVNGVIHRYDSENHVYLGSFGRGELGTITGMALDQTNGRLFVNHQGLISAFNYNTGDQLWSAANAGSGPIAYRQGNNDLITLSSGTLRRQQLASNGLFAGAIWSGLASGTQTLTTDGTRIYVVNNVNSNMTEYSGGATGTVTATSAAGAGMAGDSFVGMMTSVDGGFVFALSGTDRANYVWPAGAGSAPFVGAVSNLVTTTAVTRAHGIHGYYLGHNASSFAIQKFFESGNAFGAFSPVNLPSAIGGISFAATVVAPEPGSLIAFVVGTGLLLRRRK